MELEKGGTSDQHGPESNDHTSQRLKPKSWPSELCLIKAGPSETQPHGHISSPH